MTMPSNPSLAPVPATRGRARAVSAVLGLALLFFGSTAVRQFPDFAAQDGTAGALGTSLVVGGIPTAIGAVLVWWAVRGWQRHPEPTWTRALRYGAAGLFLWGLIGTVAIVGYYGAVQGRDAGVAPVIAWLSAPVGFLLGAAVAVVRRNP